jgi:hypothetical protein
MAEGFQKLMAYGIQTRCAIGSQYMVLETGEEV